MRKYTKIWKPVVCGLLAAVSIFSIFNIEVKADVKWPEGPEIVSPSAIVIEPYSGVVLYEKNSDEVNYPASITKIMTTMLALEYCDLEEVVTFSADAVFKNEGNTSHIARDLNEKMTMEECLYAVMLESANECAYAVAEHVGAKLGGNYQTFIDLMNKKAEELGCTNTHFNNANGLPDENHWTSAHDMALISAEAYKNENFRIITASKRYVIPPTNKHSDNTYLNNHHNMIHNYKTTKYLYEYCTGGKTGFTQAARATLVTYAEKDGITLVCVIMRSETTQYYEDTRTLFDYCFRNFKTYNISEYESLIKQEDEFKGFMNSYGSFVSLDKNASITLPVTASFADAKYTLTETGEKNGSIAELEYTYGDRIVGTTKIVAAGAEVKDNYVKDKSNSKEEANLVKIKPAYIIILFAGIAVILLLIFFGKKIYDNFYVILHNMEVQKKRKERFRLKRKERRRSQRGRRKGNRMFR